MDIWAVKETCLDRYYERASVPLQADWTVVDVGGGLGDFTVHAARSCPKGKVYAYEPFPESFALLEENVRGNELKNVRAFPCAVTGAGRDSLTLYKTGNACQHRTIGPDGDGSSAVRVPSTTLARIFEDHRIETCDFLKIDCEGGEYEILFECPESTLARIRTICLEYHDGVTPYSHTDLVRFLTGKGFRVGLLPSRAHTELGYLHAENLTVGRGRSLRERRPRESDERGKRPAC